MKKFLLGCLVLLSMVTVVEASNTINFDDLGSYLDSQGLYWSTTPVGFKTEGFQFDMALMHESYFQNTYRNSSGFPSSPIAVYSNSDDNNPYDEVTVSRDDGRKFNFYGAHIGGFIYNNTIAWYAATDLTIEGYCNGSLIDSIVINPLEVGFNYQAINFMNVDTVKFSASHGTYNYSSIGLTNQGTGSYWMMDDFEYSVVPVPGAVLLGGLGVGLVGWMRRRKTV